MSTHCTVIFNEIDYSAQLEQERSTALENVKRLKAARLLGCSGLDAEIASEQARYDALPGGSAVDHWVGQSAVRSMYVPERSPDPGFAPWFLAGTTFDATETGTAALASSSEALAVAGVENANKAVMAVASSGEALSVSGTVS